MSEIDELKTRLEETTDPKEYDRLEAQIAQLEKQESLARAARLKADREAEEARLRKLRAELDDLLTEGEKLKESVGETKPAIVEALNAAFTGMESIWAKAARMQEISRQVAVLARELGTDEVFSPGSQIWGGADLNNDPIWGARDLVKRFHDLWRLVNHPQNAPATFPLKMVPHERIDQRPGRTDTHDNLLS